MANLIESLQIWTKQIFTKVTTVIMTIVIGTSHKKIGTSISFKPDKAISGLNEMEVPISL